MKNDIFSKEYLCCFITDTQTGEDNYPVYRHWEVNNGGSALLVLGTAVPDRSQTSL